MTDDDLCECDRPDERDNPHRHERTIECARWSEGKASVAVSLLSGLLCLATSWLNMRKGGKR